MTDEQIEAIMEQAQVFASAWSLVGGVFDSGKALATAEQEKVNLRALLSVSKPAVAEEPDLSRKWVISEADLLHLMSVKIGAPYVSVQDASKRTSIAVEPLPTSIAAPAQRLADEDLWDQTLQERDTYHDWADKLADAIGLHLGVDVGELTSANNPWNEALDAIMAAPSVAELAAAPALSEEPIGDIPEGCTVADAKVLREANHALATENDALKRALAPFARLVSTDKLSWAMVEYCIDGDPEKQTFRLPQMQRAFNRAAEAYRTAAPQPFQPAQAGEPCKCRRLGDWKGFHHPLCDKAPVPSAVVLDDERAAIRALRRLEAACDRRAGLLTGEAYLAAEAIPGMRDALYELDAARKEACEALARAASPQATATQPAQTQALIQEAVRSLSTRADELKASNTSLDGTWCDAVEEAAYNAEVDLIARLRALIAAQPAQTEPPLTFTPLYKKLMRGDIDICEAYLRLNVIGSCPTEDEFSAAMAALLTSGGING